MTGRPGWFSAVLVVLAANLLPLAGWWWSRGGEPAATIEVTEDEAALIRGGEENSAVRLGLVVARGDEPGSSEGWADLASLQALGFEAEQLQEGDEVRPSPTRPRRRPAWVLLAIGGMAATDSLPEADAGWRGLRPVAVGTDPEALYRRSGDRGRHLVMRGLVRVDRRVPPADPITGIVPPEEAVAVLDLVTPATLHVPRSLLPVLERLAPTGAERVGGPRYVARIAIGRLHLPRVIGILPIVQAR